MMNTRGKLNKSHSESELNKPIFENLLVQKCHENTRPDENTHFGRTAPVIKKTFVMVQEVYHSPTMLRSGCSIPNHLQNIDDIHSKIRNSKCITFDRFVNAWDSDVILNTREESEIQSISSYYDDHDRNFPMDVDLSDDQNAGKYLDVTENMDIDIGHHNNVNETVPLITLDKVLKNRKFKNGQIILPEEMIKCNKKSNLTSCRKNRFCNFFVILIMLISSILIYFYLFEDTIIFVNRDIQLQNLHHDLTKNVYGQKASINVIIQSLKNRSYWTKKIKVLSFIGPSGTGKTFVTNILKKHFQYDLVHEFYGLHFDFKRQRENLPNHLKSCCLNLIIVDNLNKNDISELFAFIHSLPKNCYILVIPIFSIQYTDEKLNYVINFDDINEIRHKFDNSDLFHELAVFHQFDDVRAKDWLEKIIKVQNIRYSEMLLHNVLHNHNASYEGFKGLYSKYLLEVETS